MYVKCQTDINYDIIVVKTGIRGQDGERERTPTVEQKGRSDEVSVFFTQTMPLVLSRCECYCRTCCIWLI